MSTDQENQTETVVGENPWGKTTFFHNVEKETNENTKNKSKSKVRSRSKSPKFHRAVPGHQMEQEDDNDDYESKENSKQTQFPENNSTPTESQPQDPMEDPDRCRICLESGDISAEGEIGPLICPCACNEPVHAACLEKWRRMSLRFSHCGICREEFTVRPAGSVKASQLITAVANAVLHELPALILLAFALIAILRVNSFMWIFADSFVGRTTGAPLIQENRQQLAALVSFMMSLHTLFWLGSARAVSMVIREDQQFRELAQSEVLLGVVSLFIGFVVCLPVFVVMVFMPLSITLRRLHIEVDSQRNQLVDRGRKRR